MLIAHKDIGDVAHRLIYYPDTDRMVCLSSEYPEEYWATSLTKQLWATFVEGNMAWAHRGHLQWKPVAPDIDNPNQIRFSDFKDPLTDAETRKKTFTVTETKSRELRR